jgi:tetratricopeptide (TPR) repeat protein
VPATTLASIAALRKTEPHRLSQLLRGDLDWIVMKALEKDRARRYETANGLAADVLRYLADEPVTACPPTAIYRFRKFAARNKQILATAAVLAMIVLAAVGSVGGTVGWALRDRDARQALVVQQANLALNEAERLTGQGKYAEALSVARRAEAFLAVGASHELRERVRHVCNDLEMVLRLDDVRLLLSDMKGNAFDYEQADRTYEQVFGDYGVDVARMPPDAIVSFIRARPGVADAIAVALDDWAFVRGHIDSAGGRALLELAQASDLDPWRQQVRLAVKQGDANALAALAASMELRRQPPTSLALLARALRSVQQADPEALRRMQRQYPGDFWINYQLSGALSALGPSSDEEAISFLRAALAIRPQSSAVHNSLGHALGRLKKWDEAVACFRKAIELDSTYAAAHDSLGHALGHQGKLEEAVNSFRKAIERDPVNASTHYNLGLALYRQRNLDEAIVHLKKAIELNSNFAPAGYVLGLALIAQGDHAGGVACFRKVIEIKPNDAFAHNQLAWSLATCPEPHLRDPAEAVAYARRAAELEPTQGAFWNTLGVAHYRSGEWEAAIEALEQSMAVRPQGEASGWFFLAMSQAQLGRTDEARKWYDRATEWMEAHLQDADELKQFRTEAAEVLGVTDESLRRACLTLH